MWNNLGLIGGVMFATVLLNNVGAGAFEVFLGSVGFTFALAFIHKHNQ